MKLFQKIKDYFSNLYRERDSGEKVNLSSYSELESLARQIADESNGYLTFKKLKMFRHGYEMVFNADRKGLIEDAHNFPKLKAPHFPELKLPTFPKLSLPRFRVLKAPYFPNFDAVFRSFDSYVNNIGKYFDRLSFA